ncbi:DUF1707 SHOCT-like domain-containing protein [Naumannella halotolerans]|uniref:Uncharacterized protein DUF1707 n=1 Tax=Naumannella halotolerans TaxID=993414 RepID=A0A4R7J8Y1_9ACTN|nr:DUF1707 domain-containing protein [Naumannella halotolerans]TDT33744.1 uncharacterized protein DUF1707 [Naumannella halotolerans]
MTGSDDAPAFRASDADRDAVLGVLGEALANGRLTTEEFDERQNQALAARLLGDLPPLIQDLPEGRRLLARQQPEHPVSARPAGGENLPVRPGEGETSSSVAIMGGKTLLVPPGTPKLISYLLMGGDDVYLTDVMGPGVQFTIESWSMWAGNDIYVPSGVRVIDKMTNIMAGNDIAAEARGDGSNGTLILTGVNLMAGHDVKLDPGSRTELEE